MAPSPAPPLPPSESASINSSNTFHSAHPTLVHPIHSAIHHLLHHHLFPPLLAIHSPGYYHQSTLFAFPPALTPPQYKNSPPITPRKTNQTD